MVKRKGNCIKITQIQFLFLQDVMFSGCLKFHQFKTSFVKLFTAGHSYNLWFVVSVGKLQSSH